MTEIDGLTRRVPYYTLPNNVEWAMIWRNCLLGFFKDDPSLDKEKTLLGSFSPDTEIDFGIFEDRFLTVQSFLIEFESSDDKKILILIGEEQQESKICTLELQQSFIVLTGACTHVINKLKINFNAKLYLIKIKKI